MNAPPLLIKISIAFGSSTERLWLPLFLIYPFLAVFALILLPLVLVAALLLWPMGWSRTIVLTSPYLLRVICELRGLEVDIQQKNKRILIYFK
jgi:hypothetical protein